MVEIIVYAFNRMNVMNDRYQKDVKKIVIIVDTRMNDRYIHIKKMQEQKSRNN